MICVDKNKVGILKIIQRENNMKEFSTYKKDDVIFLLKDMEVIIPPIELQNQFADFVNQVNKSKVEAMD